MDAARNHGKALNETNLSRSLMRSQNPCGETLATSTPKVPSPCREDFALVLPDRPQCSTARCQRTSLILAPPEGADIVIREEEPFAILTLRREATVPVSFDPFRVVRFDDVKVVSRFVWTIETARLPAGHAVTR